MTYKVKSGGFLGFLRRNSNTISLSVIAFSIIAVFIMQALTIAQLQKEVEHQTKVIDSVAKLAKQIDQNAKDRSKQIDGIDRHLDCIVYFFSQADRSQKAIDDIDECRITDGFTYAPAESKQPSQSTRPEQAAETPLQDTPAPVEKGLVESTVDGILSIPEVVTNKLKEIL